MTPAEAIASHQAFIGEIGEDVIIRRFAGKGDARAAASTVTVKARVMGYEPHELTGPIVLGDKKAIAMAADLAALMPLRKDVDTIEIGGVEHSIEYVDDRKRRIAGVLIALEICARG